MKSAASGLVKWLFGKLGAPVDPACDELNNYFNDWDYAHTNDQAIVDADTCWDRVREAQNLLESDPKQAFNEFLTLAGQGSVWGMLQVAWCYRNGRGVASDTARAEDWYRRAFEAGSERALLGYAQLLALRGAHDLCEEVYRAGASNGWAPASYRLAIILLKRAKYNKALREVRALLERASQEECPGAQFLLARLTMFGRFGLQEIPRGVALVRAFEKRVVAETGGGSGTGTRTTFVVAR